MAESLFSFEADPHVIKLRSYNENQDEIITRTSVSKNSQERKKGDEFGPVLVTGWPLCSSSQLGGGFKDEYEEFKRDVKKCFNEVDIERTTDDDFPNVYLYPYSCLHITIATFRAFTTTTTNHQKLTTIQQQKMMEEWKSFLLMASKRPSWPSKGSSFEFQIESAQIGTKAGILLWNERTGNLHAIRQTLQLELNEYYKKKKKHNHEKDQVNPKKNILSNTGNYTHLQNDDDPFQSLLETFKIPNIVHSTFMRFHKEPQSNPSEVQKKFHNFFLSPLTNKYKKTTSKEDQQEPSSKTSKLNKLFNNIILQTNTIHFVNERTPYMHVPFDNDHIIASIML